MKRGLFFQAFSSLGWKSMEKEWKTLDLGWITMENISR